VVEVVAPAVVDGSGCAPGADVGPFVVGVVFDAGRVVVGATETVGGAVVGGSVAGGGAGVDVPGVRISVGCELAGVGSGRTTR
jgi:hypothetical protein